MSRVALDALVEAGGCRLAALVETGVEGHRVGPGLAFWGAKGAVAFLIAGPDGIRGLDAQGREMAEAEVEVLAPGAWAAFAAAVDAAVRRKER